MKEKRKYKRVPMHMQLEIESLYTSGEHEGMKLNEKILVTNISKTGMAFISSKELPLNHFFNAKITIDEEKMFYSVLRIVRKRTLKEGYEIGCEFVGLANILSEYIDEYVVEVEEREKK
ncbi:PilZ domain-containing protein [Crassaminicella profunda]|uniref:PilZ domain-containing protein n=1 Tax=Crassaminicella profunda TaxID=1286698 RepID=UPI001CA6B8EC|nr:PilZ domain-containing protein [Crassaminicella profunda]QZY53764.1 PilZ domain-containing protein [Crassaminicella profunda]